MTSALFRYPLILTQRVSDMPLPTENSIHIPAPPLFTVPHHLHFTCPACSWWRIYDYPSWHTSHRTHLTRFAYPTDGISLELGQSFCFLFLVPHAVCVGIEKFQVCHWTCHLAEPVEAPHQHFVPQILVHHPAAYHWQDWFFSHSPFQPSIKV